jgi:flagellar basal body-associated protein FliL
VADETEKEAEKASAKLKELERTLAKELDQQVRLAEPTDPRLDGTVSLNPTLDASQGKVKAPSPQMSDTPAPTASASIAGAQTVSTQQSVVKKVDDISLQDVDDLLNQLDSNFQTSMEEIKSEVGKIEAPQNLESISIGADYLKGDKEDEDIVQPDLSINIEEALPEEEEAVPLPAGRGLVTHILKFVAATVFFPLNLALQVTKELLSMRTVPPKEVLKELPTALLPAFQKWADAIKELFEKLRSYSLFTYVKFIVFIVLIGAFYLLVKDILINARTDPDKDPFLRSFSEVASDIQLLPEDDSGEDLESPLKHPEYTVLVPKIIANLKPPSPRHTPMAVLELYLETSNQECAIEVNDRQVEIKDLIERIMEQTSFDEVESAQGKLRLKVRFRAGLNRILNKGRVRRIFFKSFNIQK